MNKSVVVFGIIIFICLMAVIFIVKYKLVSKITIKLIIFKLFKFEMEVEKAENTET